MSSVLRKVQSSPLLIRVAPFFLFVLLTTGQGRLGDASQYWIYLGKIVVGIGCLALMRPLVAEMRWHFTWEAALVGVGVFALWVGLDPYYRKFGQVGPAWNPFASFPSQPALAWTIAAVRILGSALVVPALEEVFYRSFAYRYIIRPEFQSVPFNQFHGVSFVVTAAVFGLAHYEWLAGILCGFAYQGLVLRKNRLSDAITAHAITNLLLGLWVVWKGAWNFW